ncbi:MAG: PQQ-binding-like beta-propeller repeat protein [Pseudomonadota bacterium]
MKFSTIAILGSLCLGLAACAERELILDGERFDIREDLSDVPPDEGAAPQPVRTFAAPNQVNHASWTHRGGSNTHQLQHPALRASFEPVFSVNIGQGNGRKQRLTADPVIAGGRIFTLDAASRVQATGSDGAVLWSRTLVPASDNDRDASGGGLAFGENIIFAATGFGELFALDATSGATLWRQKVEAPVTSSPTYADGKVYVISRDSRAWALDIKTGRILWQLAGAPSTATLIGGSGPLMTGRLAILPFGSGELVAALQKSGLRVWGSSVAGQRRGRAYSGITDITGDPVFADGVIYAANASGRAVAIKPASGERIWTANQGAYSPLLPAGESVFLISEQGELLRLDRETGETIWSERLPYFVNRKVRRREAVYAHYGPVLAGGRLIVASNDGLIRSYDPTSGALVGTTPIRGGAASNPAIVNGTMYIVTDKGQLAAFR